MEWNSRIRNKTKTQNEISDLESVLQMPLTPDQMLVLYTG